jgi:hypothetical protein
LTNIAKTLVLKAYDSNKERPCTSFWSCLQRYYLGCFQPRYWVGVVRGPDCKQTSIFIDW